MTVRKKMGLVVLAAVLVACCSSGRGVESSPNARWIWSDPNDPAPANRFTYFRKVVRLDRLPENGNLRFAADSNARLWINGHIVRRKVARYREENITAEVVQAGQYLKPGENTVVVLHHNWGPIITFQRTGNLRAGLYIAGPWIGTDSSWRWLTAPQFQRHDKQIVGVIGDHRIRYPLMVDGRRIIEPALHDPNFDDSAWPAAVVVEDGPWPARPSDVETPGQREYPVRPAGVLAAGSAESDEPLSDDPLSMAKRIRLATCRPEPQAIRQAQQLLAGQTLTIRGQAGQTRYVTFDFHRPVHGYPYLSLGQADEGVLIDFGYAEIHRSLYSGAVHVDQTGWLNPEGVVGPGYADRYLTRAGPQRIELGEERTCRWLTVHIHFLQEASVTIEDLGLVQSQYPVDRIGSFACGNDAVEQIVRLCLIHAEVTMSDSYVDTPGREDGQWIEDARLRALIAARWFGDTRLRELMIRTHAEAQGPDGNLHPFAPSNYPAYPAGYDWSVQWVAALYDQYVWTGDKTWIERYWPHVQAYWRAVLKHVDEQGLWRTSHLFADIRVGVHPQAPHQSSGIVTPWIIERLRWSEELAREIGQTRQAEQWREMADKLTGAFRACHVVPARDGVPAHVADVYDSQRPDGPRGYSQAGQTVAVYTDLLSPTDARATLNYAFADPEGAPPAGVTRWNNPTYGYRALKALSHAGLTERAVQHLLERYAPYLPGHPRNTTPLLFQGPYGGPLPEYWVSREDLHLASGQINPAQPRDETGSHGWQCVPLLWLHETLLGVTLAEPGGGRIRIAPQAGGLPYVQGWTNTPKGPVWVNWQPSAGLLEVRIPAGCQAEVIPPPIGRERGFFVQHQYAEESVSSGPEGSLILNRPGRYVFQVR
ncbi:MAG: hypothetical protein JW810_09095 [Sedimentisphaerales bacterium]|nr:hypothetical protein [Sedimentisphaerales bacterium]